MITLLCTATRTEARACASGVRKAGAQSHFEILHTGMGMLNAKQGLATRLKQSGRITPSLIVSTGFAGSWSTELTTGSWALGRSVETEGGERQKLGYPAFLALSKAIHARSRPAEFITINSPQTQSNISNSERPRKAPVLVDMESYAWAELARETGIPFMILRVVSDTPADPLPEALSSFASISLTDCPIQRLKHLTRALSQTLLQSKQMGSFLWRSPRLPGYLETGWHDFASKAPAMWSRLCKDSVTKRIDT